MWASTLTRLVIHCLLFIQRFPGRCDRYSFLAYRECFLPSSGEKIKRQASGIQSTLFFILLTLIANQLNPLYLFFAIYVYIDRFEDLFFGTSQKSFAKRRKQVTNRIRVNWGWNLATTLVFLLIGTFLDWQVSAEWLFIDISIIIFRRLRLNIIEGYKICMVVLLTPIFLFGIFMTDKDFTIFGLANPNIIITKKDGAIVKGRLLFKDNDFFYLEDTVRRISSVVASYTPEIRTSVNIAKGEIVEYRIDTVSHTKKARHSLIQLFRQNFK